MAVTTPFGMYEWTVMPQSCRNAPATHQPRMFDTLRPWIGTMCHVYINDIAVWSQTIKEHQQNVETILLALRQYSLFASNKKTELFAQSIRFLSHRILADGIEANDRKTKKIIT
ncbi:hypothetical protein PsYK624_171430 [Phanerochaete sordida]|uniref:Reverse transcriptase domain-containing protein n=1 Tax=Phanerochaete sordida TaxID=48140 RepID=A0A9P3LMZ0_9APHY|nr:hypothetical protein PsYK624_171430 [Phanerochaete sordida]